MKEIKCPKCGNTITVDESDYAEILAQVRSSEFEKELKERTDTLLAASKSEEKALLAEQKAKSESLINELKTKVESLNQELKNKEEFLKKEAELALQNKLHSSELEISRLKEDKAHEQERIQLEIIKTKEAINEELKKRELELTKLKAEMETLKLDTDLKVENIKKQYKAEIEFKDEQISQLKDFKLKLSTKMVGESLEQYILNQFETLRATAFQSAYFGKDNDVIDGGKGDFIFRDFTPEGVEYISIMFELKNENDETATKHKNEHFFDKLDKDRKNHNCEYAVLVSMLEPENEYYNQGIVDVSYRSGFEKMYAIRPQNFISIVTLLRNAALKNIQIKNELEAYKKQNVDVADFEDKLQTFKDSFGKNVLNATSQFEKAINEIDSTISHLQKVRDALVSTANNLNRADKKLEDLSIKKLTRGNETMKLKFEEAKKEKENE